MSITTKSEEVRYSFRDGCEEELNKLTGYKPNGWQNVVRNEDYRFKVICVGRRGGKSLYVVFDPIDGIVRDLVTPNQYVWIVAPNYDLTQRVWNEVYSLAISKFKPIIKSVHNTKGDFKIITNLGTTIEAKSAEEPEKLVGAGLTKIIIDEAALVKQKAWTQSLRPTLIDHHGKAIFISTPKGKNWFWELWMKGDIKEEVEWKSWRFTSYDNEYIDKAEVDGIVRDMPDFEYRQEILAQFEETAEQIFRKFRERAIGEFKEPVKGHRYSVGIDLGRKTSYSVITVIDEMEFPYQVVHWDRFKTVDWAVQKDRIKAVWDKYPCLRMRLDSTGIGDPILDDLERFGVRIEPYQYTEKTQRQVIDKLSIYIQEGKVIYPKIQELLNELETFGREISKETGRVKYKPLGKFQADCVHSLALACWGLIDKARKVKIEDEDEHKYKPISEITGY